MDTSEVLELGILGLLAEEPDTLEGIRDRFNHNFSRHQFAGYGVLRPMVDQLREDGYVTGRETITATDQGRARLRGLLRTPVEDVRDPGHRSHLFVKLALLHHLPDDGQHAELAQLEEQFDNALEGAREVENAHDDGDGIGHRRALFALHEAILETYREWIAERRQTITS